MSVLAIPSHPRVPEVPNSMPVASYSALPENRDTQVNYNVNLVPRPEYNPRVVPQVTPQVYRTVPQQGKAVNLAGPSSRSNGAFQGSPATQRAAAVIPTGNTLLEDAQIGHVLRTAPKGSHFLRSSVDLSILESRLPSNYTNIREDIVDTFSCDGRVYGYYADQENGCQIYHVCLPLRQFFPESFTTDTTKIFSFICPFSTIFDQSSMTCVGEEEAIPCEIADNYYNYNYNFFTMVKEEDGSERYAQVNEDIPVDPAASLPF
nr:uncharacterized protein LOC128704160 [Cherax quadricarinatus]